MSQNSAQKKSNEGGSKEKSGWQVASLIIGILILGSSGLCTLEWIISTKMGIDALFMAFLFGGLPMLFGIMLIRFGKQ